MNLALEFLIFRLNAIDGVETVHGNGVVSIEYEGKLVARVYASIGGESPRETVLLEALSQVPEEVRKDIGWELLMYRLSIRKDEKK